jgi:three-Cys-motif partner protein
MAVPTGILWERDPHTAAKHTLLRRYLMAWFPIMAKQFQGGGITFLDGFAGPGEYTNSQESSPVIAMEQAMRDEVVQLQTPTRLVFIEERKDRAEHLEPFAVPVLRDDEQSCSREVQERTVGSGRGLRSALPRSARSGPDVVRHP